MFGILAVHTLATYPEMNNPIKMEVGIEECLHIEFEYNKSKYHLKVDKLGQTLTLVMWIPPYVRVQDLFGLHAGPDFLNLILKDDKNDIKWAKKCKVKY